jgi:predicted DNA-binding protein
MPLEMISKLKAIAGYFGKPEVGIVLEILEKGIADYETQYGSCVSDINRGNS